MSVPSANHRGDATLPARSGHGRKCPPASEGFTTLELLIVIGIIVAVLAISVAVYARMRVAAKSQAAMTSMGFLCNAALRYQQIVPIPLLDRDAGLYFVDFNGNGVKDGADRTLTPMEYFLLRTSETPDCLAQLAFVPRDMQVAETLPGTATPAVVNICLLSPANTPSANTLLKTGYALKTVKDLWGNEIKFRSLSNATLINLDASVGEQDAAIPYADFPFFASAGPDGRWGALSGHDANLPDADAKDNLYSFAAHQ